MCRTGTSVETENRFAGGVRWGVEDKRVIAKEYRVFSEGDKMF